MFDVSDLDKNGRCEHGNMLYIMQYFDVHYNLQWISTTVLAEEKSKVKSDDNLKFTPSSAEAPE